MTQSNEIVSLAERRSAAAADSPDAPPIAVLKFGHSVFQTPDDVTRVANEIYRHVREGWRVVAVMSAIGGETGDLLRLAEDLEETPNPEHLPKLLRVGEYKAAALTALALSRIGVAAVLADPQDFGLTAEGDLLDANLASVDAAWLKARLSEVGVVVAPGFLAYDEKGRLAALGRGGTDLTAVFLAEELEADRVRLLKDVDGVYQADPKAEGESPGRFATTSWDICVEVGGAVVQPKAVTEAKERGQTLEVASYGREDATLVGDLDTTFHIAAAPPRLKVALLGLGAVGRGVYEHLIKHPEYFEIVNVLVRSPKKYQGVIAHKDRLTSDAASVGTSGADLVVELIGGLTDARDHVIDALKRGADVVSANKTLVAYHYPELVEAAGAAASLRYSAAVAGGIPVIEEIDRSAGKRPIRKIEALLNGTCNFILGKLEEGGSLDAAVKTAQDKGFAEADPSADVDGRDAAEKLAILARHAFGVSVPMDEVAAESLRTLKDGAVADAVRRGKAVKQIARCEKNDDGLSLAVRLEEVDAASPFAKAKAEAGCAKIYYEDGGVVTLTGKGAGRWPTSEAVFADIMDVWRKKAMSGDAGG
ncbi:MAG: homoserine dehydrogenase [Pseudomonadota bacterium]